MNWKMMFFSFLISSFPLSVTGDTLVPQRDPFAKPAPAVKQVRSEEIQDSPDTLELRAILIAEPASIANIGGTMVTVGNEINGYRLISLTEEGALFQKGAKKYPIKLRE